MTYAIGNRRGRRADARGFTLIEIIVVIAIMAAATGIVVGLNRFGLAGLHLKGSARDLITTMRYARERAVTQQTVFKVVFQMNDHQFYLADEMERFRRSATLNSDIRFRRIIIDGLEVRNQEMVGAVFFYPNGSSNSAVIVLENRRGAKMKIVTDLLTGAAKIVPLGPGD